MNCEHLHDIEGLQFMPVKENKQPILKGWQTSTVRHDLTNCAGVGLVCGSVSGGLEVIDVDSKYDLTGGLFAAFKKQIHETDSTLLEKLVVQKTRGGGFHLIYRCKFISGNLKLANRPTTDTERQETYNKTYQTEILNGDDAAAVLKARKASQNDKVRVLLETRGEGGFIMCCPSKGYELMHRDYYGICDITIEQREIIHTIARSFNQVVDEIQITKAQQPKIKINGKSSFDDYNERGDVIGLLERHGWLVVNNRGNKTHLLRPGQTTSQTSGNYDHSLGWFSVFTTSTEFEPQHGYRPYAIFAILECNKDFSEASKRLYELGYGDRAETQSKEKAPSTRVIQSRVDPNDNDLSFLATGADYDEYLQQVIDGTLPMGLTTGSPELDKYFLLKKGSFVMFNGHDNVGKSVFVWFLLMLSSMYHGWTWIVFSSENTLGSFMRKMIQFYWGKPLRGYNSQTTQEFDIAKAWVEKHFKIIKHEESMYNYKDIMNMIRKARKAMPQFKCGFIDPYNSLKIDLSGFSKISTHEYHYEAMSELQADCQANGFTWFVNHHVITEATRKVDSDGYQIAPNKADTEGGAKVANKAHDFATIHRKTNHPQDWSITEFHTRKIKDTETGGRVSPLNEPTKFQMNKNGCGFTEYLETGGHPVDPIQRWHQTRTAKTDEEKHWADRKDFKTFEQFQSEQQTVNETQVVDPLKNYEPDDEEKKALEELLAKGDPF